MQLFQIGYHAEIDVSILGLKSTDMKADIAEEKHQENRESRANLSINCEMKQFNRTENTGTEISYRCIKCRSNNPCKNHENLETVSVKEEIEQDLINNSVSVHTEKSNGYFIITIYTFSRKKIGTKQTQSRKGIQAAT